MKTTTPPDTAAIAQMAAAIQRRLGTQALDFSRRQLSVAEGDMVAVWAAIVLSLDAAA